MKQQRTYCMMIAVICLLLFAGTASGAMQVAAGHDHTVGLKTDGTVVATGYNFFGQCDVSSWTGIVQVAAGAYHTVGLKSDGTVKAVGDYYLGKCNVSSWTGIVQVAAGYDHTVGLKSDGTVVAVGDNSAGQCDVSSWTGIVQVSAVYFHTVGLKANGTVVAVGDNSDGRCDVSSWLGIVQVSAGNYHTVGLRSDGTVVAVGANFWNQCNVSSWTGIVQMSAGGSHTVGLKSDGTVVAVGDNYYDECNVSSWTGIVQVGAGNIHTVGLKSDGTVVAVGDNAFGKCDVFTWDLDEISNDRDNDGVPNADDCAPDDATRFKSWTVYLDSDSDGYGAGTAVTICGGATIPVGYSEQTGDNCPNDPLKIQPGACGCNVADTDSDGDGVPDCKDVDPNSNTEPAITIQGCATGVSNAVFPDGSTMSDQIGACAASAKNHGAFVSCVTKLTNGWKAQGLISNKDKSAIQGCSSKAK